MLPTSVDRREPSVEEATRALLEISLRALGICAAAQVGDYFHLRRTESKPFIDGLLAEGRFVPVTARLADGASHELVVHRDNLRLLERAADGALQPRRTTFLSPFDSLFWARDRDQRCWRFRQVLECYKPQPAREWGYFCLPILHRDRLVGRFDPKLERSQGAAAAQEAVLGAGRQTGRAAGRRGGAQHARLPAFPRRRRPGHRAQRSPGAGRQVDGRAISAGWRIGFARPPAR